MRAKCCDLNLFFINSFLKFCSGMFKKKLKFFISRHQNGTFFPNQNKSDQSLGVVAGSLQLNAAYS